MLKGVNKGVFVAFFLKFVCLNSILSLLLNKEIKKNKYRRL